MRQLDLKVEHAITGVSLSPDGLTLAVAVWHSSVKLFHAITGEYITGLKGRFDDVRFSPDGAWVIGTGQQIGLIPVHRSDRNVIWGSGTTRRVGAFTTEQRAAFADQLQCLNLQLPIDATDFTDYTQNFEKYATAKMWPANLIGGKSRVISRTPVGITANNQVIVWERFEGINRGTAILYDLNTMTCVAQLSDIPEYVEYSVFTSCGDWFALSRRTETVLYNLDDLTRFTPLPAPPPPVASKPTSILTSFLQDWFPKSQPAQPTHTLPGVPKLLPRRRVPAVGVTPHEQLPFAFTPNGESFLCKGNQAIIELRDTETGEVRTSWRFTKSWPRVFAVSPDGLTALAAARGGSVLIWDLE